MQINSCFSISPRKSQPCHWRNLKGVAKREVSNYNITASFSTPAVETSLLSIDETDLSTHQNEVSEKSDISLSENVSLFQSLRVLQEGETDDDDLYGGNGIHRQWSEAPANHTCLKTATAWTALMTFSALLCLLTASLMVACTRLRQRKKQSTLYDSYIIHKGQID